jgi:hypothetical protein
LTIEKARTRTQVETILLYSDVVHSKKSKFNFDKVIYLVLSLASLLVSDVMVGLGVVTGSATVTA